MRIGPYRVPGIDPAGHIAAKQPRAVIAPAIKALLPFPIGDKLWVVLDGPVSNLPTVSPGSPAPAHEAVGAKRVETVVCRHRYRQVESADGKHLWLTRILIKGAVQKSEKIRRSQNIVFDGNHAPILTTELPHTGDH